jgi:cell division protein FtsB
MLQLAHLAGWSEEPVMQIWRGVKRRVRSAVAPCLFLSLAGYFLWSATQGDHGLNAAAERQAMLENARIDVVRADAERAVWERRVGAMRAKNLDRDALDERVRAMLNLSDPADIILLYPQNQKLF